jgi:hypothetical protein
MQVYLHQVFVPLTFEGEVRAVKSPAAFEGTPVELVLDTLLGWPTNDVPFDLSCTSLQLTGSGTFPGNVSFPKTPSPDSFEWIKRKRHAADSAVSALLERWHGEADDSSYYERHPHRRNRSSADAGYEHPRNSDVYGRHHHSHNNGHAPEQPPQSSILEQLDNAGVFSLSLSTDDVTLNGSLTQADFTNWG